MPYIPQFNKLSLQEMSYAPSLLRQQHDDAVAKQMELAEALKFDYLKQDAPGIEPVLQQYNTDIEDVSKQIAQQGFTQDIKNKVLGLRSKFVTDDKIRQYKKNYSDAMTGWEDLKKRMIQEGRPGDDINKQKAAYFSGYKGAFDDEGFKQEFTAGRTSGYYDIAEDAKKAMTNLGTTGSIVGNSGTKIELRNDLPGGGSYFRVTDTKTGQYVDNKDQRAAVAEYLKNEYGNPSTDRGLFAQISGINQADIYSTIDNVSRSMAENRYAQLPQTDTNISGLTRGEKAASNGEPMPKYNIPSLNAPEYKAAQEDQDALSGLAKTNVKISKTTPLNPWEKEKFFESASSEDYKKGIIKKYKEKYPKLFQPGVNETKAAMTAAEYEKAYSGINSSFYALKSKDIVENIYNSILSTGDEPVLERVDSKGDKSIKSMSDIAKSFEKSGVDWKQVPPLVNPYGVTLIRDSKDNLYKVNESAFDETTQNLKSKVIKPIMDQMLDPQLFDKDSQPPVEVIGYRSKYPNGLFLDVDIDRTEGKQSDPYNIEDRVINMVTPSGNFSKDGKPLYYKIKTVLPGELTQELIGGIGSGFQSYVK